ncbi:MAG: VOC family protein [Caldilineales bacterium]
MTPPDDLPINRSMPASTVIPVLAYPDVSEAVAWLCRAFGFRERLRIGNHRAQLAVGGGAVALSRQIGDPASASPAGYSIMVRVADADAHYRKALAAGALIVSSPADFPYGERQYTAEDLAGHIWTFSQTVADVDPAKWGGRLVGDLLD